MLRSSHNPDLSPILLDTLQYIFSFFVAPPSSLWMFLSAKSDKNVWTSSFNQGAGLGVAILHKQ